MRMFVMVVAQEEFSSGVLKLRFDTYGNNSTLFTFLQDKARAIDLTHEVTEEPHMVFLDRFSSFEWTYADFPLSYDPNINVNNYKDATFELEVTGINNTDLTLQIDGQGIQSVNRGDIHSFVTGSESGSYNALSANQEIKESSVFDAANQFQSEVGGAFKDGQKFRKFINKISSEVDSTSIANYPILGTLQNALRTIASSSPIGNAAIAAIGFFVGGGTKSGISFPSKYYTATRLKGTGTMDTKKDIPSVEIAIPGGTDNDNLPTGVIVGNNYNKPLGVYAIKSTPNIIYK